MKRFKVSILFIAILSVLAIVLTGCGGGGETTTGGGGESGGTTTTRSYLGTQSPGDVWSWTITTDANGSGTFSAENKTLNLTYSGTVSTLPNRFLKLTVTNTNDPNINLPAYAYALEIPDTALLVKPAGDDTKVIVAAALGTCPTTAETYNWIVIPWPQWNASNSHAYGVTNSSVVGSNFSFSHNFYLLNGSSAGTSVEDGYTCSNGEITKVNDDLTVAIAPSGFFVGDEGPGDGGFAGMAAPSEPVDLSATGVLAPGKEYRGVLFKYNSAGEDTEPVWARPNQQGGLTGGGYTNFEANIEDTLNTATLTFARQNSPGIVNGTLTDGSGSYPFVLMINRINGKYIIVGISTQGTSMRPYNFIVMEK